MLHDSLKPPLELILEWQTSKFPHGIRRGWTLVIVIGILFPICLIAVVLRTRVRVRRRSFGIDDGLIIFAVFFGAAVDISIILGFRLYGYDRHAWDLTQPMALQARQCILAIELLNSTSTCLTKISILCFYRRLGRGAYTTAFLVAVHVNIALIVAYLVSFSAVLAASCRPAAAYWLQFSLAWTRRHAYRCFDEAAVTLAANAVSIAQDLVACGLPSALLWKLQMGRKKKVLLGMLLGLGILPCVAGLLRLLATVPVYAGYDATWATHPVLVWTVVENHLGILCACAPALHSYAKEALDKAPPWLRSGRLCAGTLSLLRYLSTLGTGSSSSSSSSSAAARSFFRRGGGGGGGGGGGYRGEKRSGRRASGHVELDEGVGNDSGGGGGRVGSGSGSDGSGGRRNGSIGSAGRKGKRDSGGGRSAGTLLSSLSTLDEARSERSTMAGVEDADSDAGAADDGDLERGFFAPSGRREDRNHLQSQRAAGGDQVSQDQEIGVAVTADPPTVPGLLYDGRNGSDGVERS